MHKKEIKTSHAPTPNGSYSQAVQIGAFIYTSGQLPIDNIDNKPLHNLSTSEQAYQVFKNLNSVLNGAGADLSDVIKVTIFITDMNNWKIIDGVYRNYFTGPVLPARSIVGVNALHFGVELELEAIAINRNTKYFK